MKPQPEDLIRENEELRARLEEAEEALNAIRSGEVDAIVVSGRAGEKIFSLTSAETPYRILIEEMEEGAVTLNGEGIILYCNKRFITMTGMTSGEVIGKPVSSFVIEEHRPKLRTLIKKGRKTRSSDEFKLNAESQQNEFYLFTANSLPEGITGELFLIVSNITAIHGFEQQRQSLVKQLEVERKRFKEVLDIIPAYIVLIDIIDFSINYSNNYFKHEFGQSKCNTCHEIIYGRTTPCDRCGIENIFSFNYPFYGEKIAPNGKIYQVVRFPFTSEGGKSLIFEMGTEVSDSGRG